MRWVDRGPEPNVVAQYAHQFTKGWVNYFQNQVGGRPTDSFWRVFRQTLAGRTNNVCWYCERRCQAGTEVGGRAPTVDHFRPLSRFPQLAYDWSNWIFSCRRCNENKDNRWPELGYVDPCAAIVAERPQYFLDYDTQTGEIVPKQGLSANARRKAQDTIDNLKLNQSDVRFYRLDWTRALVEDLLSFPASERPALVELFTAEAVEFVGVTSMVVEQLRLSGQLFPEY